MPDRYAVVKTGPEASVLCFVATQRQARRLARASGSPKVHVVDTLGPREWRLAHVGRSIRWPEVTTEWTWCPWRRRGDGR